MNRNSLDVILLTVLALAALLVGCWKVTGDWWLSAGLGIAAVLTSLMLAIGRRIGAWLNRQPDPRSNRLADRVLRAYQEPAETHVWLGGDNEDF